jgi:hypothetical protein
MRHALLVVSLFAASVPAQPVLTLPRPGTPPAGPTPLTFREGPPLLQGRAFALTVDVRGDGDARAKVAERLEAVAKERLAAARVTAPLPTTLRTGPKAAREVTPTLELRCVLAAGLACSGAATGVVKLSPGRASYGVVWASLPGAIEPAATEAALLALADAQATRLVAEFSAALDAAETGTKPQPKAP